KALNSAIANGATVSLVTGRRFASARLLSLELGLQSPLISHNGALTKDAATLDVIDYHPLLTSIAHQLIDIGHKQNVDFILCEDPVGLGKVVVEKRSLERNPRLNNYVNYVKEYGLSLEVVNDLLDYQLTDVIQVMYTGTVQKMEDLSSLIEREIGNEARRQWTTYREADMTILDLLNPVCSKGHGVAALARSLAIPREQVLAIGDNFNDVEMLKYAGLGIIMGNAEPGLKSLGFTETATNDEDGVALALETHVL